MLGVYHVANEPMRRHFDSTGAFIFLAGVAPSIALAQDQRVSAASPSGTYLLGPTDRVRLKVYGEADITGEYEVDSNGFVSIPLRAT